MSGALKVSIPSPKKDLGGRKHEHEHEHEHEDEHEDFPVTPEP